MYCFNIPNLLQRYKKILTFANFLCDICSFLQIIVEMSVNFDDLSSNLSYTYICPFFPSLARLCNLHIAQNGCFWQKMHVFLQKICIYEKNVVPLHPLLRNKRVSLFSRKAERRPCDGHQR